MLNAKADIVIGGRAVPPGRSARFGLPFAKLPTGTDESVPVYVVNGRKPGPVVWLSAAVHGDELNGVAIIRRVAGHLDARRIAGSVVAVPVVNVFGFLHESRELPDGRDLNRSFPGSPRGSLAARLAHLFMTEIVAHADVGIDIHTAADHRVNAPQIRADLADPETMRLAQAFGADFTINARVRDGSLRQAAIDRGRKVLLYEAGGTQRFEADPIDKGIVGILRVLQELGMGTWDVPGPPETTIVHKTKWVRASRAGIVDLAGVNLGQWVVSGERLGTIGDAFGLRGGNVTATATGRVIAKTFNPLVSQGDALVHVATPGESGTDEPAERRRK